MNTILNFLEALVALDVKTLMGVLIWGNFALAVLSFEYYVLHGRENEKSLINRFGIARTIQFFAWVLLFFRGEISDIVSIYIGNILLFTGFYLDSIITLYLIKEFKRALHRLQIVLLASISIIFIILEIIFSKGNIRVAIASLSVFVLLCVPTIRSIFNKKSGRFLKFIGFSNLLFLILLLLRAMNSLIVENTSLYTNNLIQSGTFITLILLMFFNGAGFLLLMYEQSYELLKILSNLDPLTQISNRRHFMKKAEDYYQRNIGEQKQISLLFVDIDYFKKVNDNYGHLFGDEVLKVIAKVVSENTRPTDLCCRFGGEEFLILLNETNKEQAIAIGERMRETVQKLKFEDESGFRCTISVGIFSDVPNSQRKLQNFIDKADQALYKAKESGRNCVVIL